jgi:cytosine/adenosine deaminase-related metal-dependent hydrolase
VDVGIQSKWNPFEMMRTAALMQKLSHPDYRRWPTSAEILRMATYGGARSELIHEQVGALAAGMKADVILLDLSTPYFTPLNNIKTQLVYSEPGSSVHTSIINGEVVMEDRRVVTVDVEALTKELRALMPAFWKEQEVHQTVSLAHEVRPHMEAAYWRAVRTPTGLNRWLGDERNWERPKE